MTGATIPTLEQEDIVVVFPHITTTISSSSSSIATTRKQQEQPKRQEEQQQRRRRQERGRIRGGLREFRLISTVTSTTSIMPRRQRQRRDDDDDQEEEVMIATSEQQIGLQHLPCSSSSSSSLLHLPPLYRCLISVIIIIVMTTSSCAGAGAGSSSSSTSTMTRQPQRGGAAAAAGYSPGRLGLLGGGGSGAARLQQGAWRTRRRRSKVHDHQQQRAATVRSSSTAEDVAIASTKEQAAATSGAAGISVAVSTIPGTKTTTTRTTKSFFINANDEVDQQDADSHEVELSAGRGTTENARHLNSKKKKQKKKSSRYMILGGTLAGMTVLSLGAKFGLVPGPPLLSSGADVAGSYGVYTDGMIIRDCSMTLLTAILGYAFVEIITAITIIPDQKSKSSLRILQPRDARKIIHTFSAPLFMLFWPGFSIAYGSRYYATIVPIINAFRLYMASKSSKTSRTTSSSSTELEEEEVDTGDVSTRLGASSSISSSSSDSNSESALAAAISRSGDASEAIGGPFIYTIMLAIFCGLFWRDASPAPIGIIALSTMAAGDGMADIIGRRFGKNNKWPVFDQNKSIAGTAAFWFASTITSIVLILWMIYWNCFTFNDIITMSTSTTTLPLLLAELVIRIATITGIASILEVIPLTDDNYTVPISSALLTYLFFSLITF